MRTKGKKQKATGGTSFSRLISWVSSALDQLPFREVTQVPGRTIRWWLGYPYYPRATTEEADNVSDTKEWYLTSCQYLQELEVKKMLYLVF